MHHHGLPARQGEEGIKQCHVYLVLPGTTHFTTAGTFEIERNRDGIPQGRFVYGRDYLDNPDAVPIDPYCLDKLNDTVYRTIESEGIFSSLRDASPGKRGRAIIRHAASQKPLSRVDDLLLSPEDRFGALGFGATPNPQPNIRKYYKIADLERLAAIAETINFNDEITEETDTACIRDMMPFQTGLRGGRPKVSVEDAGALWLAKFNHKGDTWNHVRIERAMLELAKSCGIRSVRSRVETVAGRDVLLVERFDREKTDLGYLRYRTTSGTTALSIEHFHGKQKNQRSYARLAEVLRRVCSRPLDVSKELFRRMVFSALISNTDDRPANYAIISKPADWNLSPAYDLTPSITQSVAKQRNLKLICGIRGRQANAKNLLSECDRFLVRGEEAAAIIDAMECNIRNNWYGIARREGVMEADCGKIADAFAYPSFRQTPEELGSLDI